MVYQRNKKAKGDPPFQQQSKRGYRRNPVTCPVQPGQQPASPAWWPVNRAATGLQRRSQQIRFAPGQPGSRPAGPVLRPVHRAATGRQPAANRRSSRTSQKASGHWSGQTGLSAGLSGLWPGQTGFVEEKLRWQVETAIFRRTL
jgi:hypothetical protein